MQITTMTQKGQVTIPKNIRDELDLKPGDKVISEKSGKQIIIRPAPDFFTLKGSLKSKKKYDERKAREAIGKYLAEKYLKTLES